MKCCAYRVSTTVSHIMGKSQCQHPPRYVFMGKDYCARCIVKVKAADHGAALNMLREAARGDRASASLTAEIRKFLLARDKA